MVFINMEYRAFFKDFLLVGKKGPRSFKGMSLWLRLHPLLGKKSYDYGLYGVVMGSYPCPSSEGKTITSTPVNQIKTEPNFPGKQSNISEDANSQE